MQESLILAYHAQIWKFGPGPQKWNFSKSFSFLWKGLQISLPTSPQPPPDIKFKSSYARKHIIKKVESRTQLLEELPVLHLRGLWYILYICVYDSLQQLPFEVGCFVVVELVAALASFKGLLLSPTNTEAIYKLFSKMVLIKIAH